MTARPDSLGVAQRPGCEEWDAVESSGDTWQRSEASSPHVLDCGARKLRFPSARRREEATNWGRMRCLDGNGKGFETASVSASSCQCFTTLGAAASYGVVRVLLTQ